MKQAIVFGVVTLLLAACSSGDTASPQASSGQGDTSADAAVTTGPDDPLEGEWRQTYTCEDQLRAFLANMHLITANQRRDLADAIGSTNSSLPHLIAATIRDFAWGPNAATATPLTPTALCAGAEAQTAILRVDNGQMVMGAAGEEPGVAAYKLLDGHTLTMNDGGQNIEGTYRFTFRIEGDRLWFEQVGKKEQDPWAGTPPERAPFVRVN